MASGRMAAVRPEEGRGNSTPLRRLGNSGGSCTVAFLSSEGLSGDATALATWRESRRKPEHDQAVLIIADQVPCDPAIASRFPEDLLIPVRPMPRRGEITDIGLRTTARYLNTLGRSDTRAADASYTWLVERIAQSSTDVPDTATNPTATSPANSGQW
jgi:hypothetical protein